MISLSDIFKCCNKYFSAFLFLFLYRGCGDYHFPSVSSMVLEKTEIFVWGPLLPVLSGTDRSVSQIRCP